MLCFLSSRSAERVHLCRDICKIPVAIMNSALVLLTFRRGLLHSLPTPPSGPKGSNENTNAEMQNFPRRCFFVVPERTYPQPCNI
jgi:hypothetical protein